MTNRKISPATSLYAPLPFIIPEKLSLGNGVAAYLVNGGTEQIVKVEILFEAGSYFQNKPLVAFSTASLLKSGTKTKTAAQISEIFDFFGVYLHTEALKDLVIVSLFVLQKYLEPALELLKEIISEPVFVQKELDIVLQNRKTQYIVDSSKVKTLAGRQFRELLFGSNHPYGYRLQITDFDNVTREDLISYHQKWIQPHNFTIVVSGNLPDNLHGLLFKHFGAANWPANHHLPEKPSYTIADQARQRTLIPKEDSLQSAIQLGKRTINRSHPDFHRLVITNALLGGFFGSRLMKNIRQEKGFTYDISSTLVSLVRETYFFVRTQVGVEVCQEALDQIYHELKSLRNLPAGPDELQTLKNSMAGNFLRSFDGPFAQAGRLKEILFLGEDPANFEKFLVELKNCTPEIIMQTAADYLHEDSMIEVVAGKI